MIAFIKIISLRVYKVTRYVSLSYNMGIILFLFDLLLDRFKLTEDFSRHVA